MNDAGDFALVRYNPDGSLDTAFGSGGKVVTDFGEYDSGFAAAIQPDGKIVVVGYTSYITVNIPEFAMAQLQPGRQPG